MILLVALSSSREILSAERNVRLSSVRLKAFAPAKSAKSQQFHDLAAMEMILGLINWRVGSKNGTEHSR